MMKNLIFLCFLFCITTGDLQAQEIFLQFGKNYTSYRFTDPINEVPTMSPNYGNLFIIGYTSEKSFYSPINYDIGISINEYNAKGIYGTDNLDYKTNYLGMFGRINMNIYKDDFNSLAIIAGLSAESIINGNQSINNKNYDLLKQKEFKGLILSPHLGFKYTYLINSDLNFILDYSFSKHFNLTYSGNQKLTLQNHGLRFGLSINMY